MSCRYIEKDDGEWCVVAWPHSCVDGKSGVYRPQWGEGGAFCKVLSHTTALIMSKKELNSSKEDEVGGTGAAPRQGDEVG